MSAMFTEATPVSAGDMGTVEALARLARCRDGNAWSAIVHRHGMAIWRLAQRITGDSSLCDDVCQETLLQIREHAAQFKPPAAPFFSKNNEMDAESAARGWIMCIAYRTALGMLRLRQRRGETELKAGLCQPRVAPNASDAVLTAEELERVRGEIAVLPELLRSAVSLHFYGEMSYPELGAALDCSERAARKRVERGVSRLRDRLAEGGVAISLSTLMLALYAPAKACGAGAAVAAASAGASVSAAGAAPVSELLTVQQLAQWQALLHHSAPPLLAGAVKMGGIAIMTKYLIGAAAVLFFGVATVQNYRIGALSEDLSVTRQQANQVAALQTKLDALEKQFAESRGDAEALRANVVARSDQVMQLEAKVKALEEGTNGTVLAYNNGQLYAYRAMFGAGGTQPTPAAGATDPTAYRKVEKIWTEKAVGNGQPVPMGVVNNGLPATHYITPDGNVVVQTAPATGTAGTTGAGNPYSSAQTTPRALVPAPDAPSKGPGVKPPEAPMAEKPRGR